MPKVLNTHTGPLDVAGRIVAPGGEAEVEQDELDAWAEGAAAAEWLKTGLVDVVKPKRAKAKPKAEADQAED